MNGHALADNLRELKDDIQTNVDNAAESGLEQHTKPEAERIIRTKDIEYQGYIRRSLRVVERKDGDGYVLKAGGDSAPHAPLVEMGTGSQFDSPNTEASFGPYDAPDFSSQLVNEIGKWIDEKGISAHTTTQSNLKWVIAASIAEKGTSRQPFMNPSWFHTVDDLKKEGRKALKKSVDDL